MSNSRSIPQNGHQCGNPHSDLRLMQFATAFSNLFYEFMFIADIRTGRITYVANSSGLATRVLKHDFTHSTVRLLIETISGSDAGKLSRIFNIIRTYYDNAPAADRSHLLFMTDMQYIFDVEGKSNALYKFTPLAEPDGELNSMLISISFSAGHYHDKILMINTRTFDRMVYDMDTYLWEPLTYDALSPIETAVLALSAEGRSIPQIATAVNRAYDSVKSIRKRIFSKLKVSNITEAIICGINYKII
ncbi:MAG: helix-turn-helix transcriptional regulator [Muribaculaceae bacterium]|nr:helix-turn-helix transcriptional regulator [Muribaculaceae bacterium]